MSGDDVKSACDTQHGAVVKDAMHCQRISKVFKGTVECAGPRNMLQWVKGTPDVLIPYSMFFSGTIGPLSFIFFPII